MILLPSKTDMNLIHAARRPLALMTIDKMASIESSGGDNDNDENDDGMMMDDQWAKRRAGVEFEIKILKSQDFKYEYAKQRMHSFLYHFQHGKGIVSSNASEHGVTGNANEATRNSRFQSLSSSSSSSSVPSLDKVGNHFNWLDSSEHLQMVRAGGALVQFIQTNRLLFGELDGDVLMNMISKISSLSLYVCVRPSFIVIVSCSYF